MVFSTFTFLCNHYPDFFIYLWIAMKNTCIAPKAYICQQGKLFISFRIWALFLENS